MHVGLDGVDAEQHLRHVRATVRRALLAAEGVVVTGTVTTKVQDKVAFLVEAHQAGIFDIRNVPDEQLDPLLGIACPTILYPYLRGNIADVITRAGFQAIHLSEINFQALYEQRLQAAMEEAQGQGGDSGIVMPDGSQARH